MAPYHEVDDGGVNDSSDSREDYLEGRIFRIRFSMCAGKISGRVIRSDGTPHPDVTKIVFPGRCWRGPLPVHGQELEVCVARDTKSHDPTRGALIVERRRIDASKGAQCNTCPDCGSPKVRQFDVQTGRSLTETTCPDCNGVFEIFWQR